MIRRRLTEEVRLALNEARAVCILGARQAGKSTILRQLADELEIEVKDLDQAATRRSALEDPQGFIADLELPVAIDEVQRAPELLLAMKYVLDRDNRAGQFLLTGSANLRAIPKVADALPGRVDYLTLNPFTQSELNGDYGETFVDHVFTSAIPQWQMSDLVGRKVYAPVLVTGGYPEALRRSQRTRSRFFESYIETVLGRDLGEISYLHKTELLPEILRLIAVRTGSPVNFTAIGEAVGLDTKSVQRHIQLLEQLFLVRRILSWSGSKNKRLVRAPKFYISDSGLFAHLVDCSAELFVEGGDDAGKLMETFAVNEIARTLTWSSVKASAYYYRDQHGREVDCVLQRPSGEVVGIEVKATASPSRSDFRPLRYLRERIGDRFRCGLLLNTSAEVQAFGERLYSAPLAALWQGSTELPKRAIGNPGDTNWLDDWEQAKSVIRAPREIPE